VRPSEAALCILCEPRCQHTTIDPADRFTAASLALIGCGSQQNAQVLSRFRLPYPPLNLCFFTTGRALPRQTSRPSGSGLATEGIDYATADSGKLNGMKRSPAGRYKADHRARREFDHDRPKCHDTNYVGDPRRGDTVWHALPGNWCRRFLRGIPIYNGVESHGGVSFNFYADDSGNPYRAGPNQHGPRRLAGCVLAGRSPAFRGGAVVARFPDGTPAIVKGSRQGIRHLHRRPPGGSGKLARVNEFRTPVESGPRLCGHRVPSALNGTPLPALLVEEGTADYGGV